ncbi:MAG: hypothetical protein HGN29_15810 [Asgard group archaeon]|nr:hypothetical protein [Asgard group archaeon]
MSEEEQEDKIDKVLKVLSKPFSKHILATLAGVDPGKFIGKINSQNGEKQDKKE